MLPVVQPHQQVRLHRGQERVLNLGGELVVVIQDRRGRIAVIENGFRHMQVVDVPPQGDPLLLDREFRDLTDFPPQVPEPLNILLGI